MSILIQGLSMPDEGCHHTICIYSDGKVETGEPNSYQAVPVPPHGRLIDADALMDSLLVDYPSVVAAIDTAPTVIEAEGE